MGPKGIMRWCALAVLALLVACAAALLGLGKYFSTHWYPNTYINGVEYSWKPYGEPGRAIENQARDYRLAVIGRNGGRDEILGSEIGLRADVERALGDLFRRQHAAPFWAAWFHKTEETLACSVSFDEAALAAQLRDSVLLTGDASYGITQPESARVVYSEEKKAAVVEESVEGNVLIAEAAKKYLAEAIAALRSEVDFTDEAACPDAYQRPVYRTGDDAVWQAMWEFNQYLHHWVVWDMGEGVSETLSPEEIKDWLLVDQDQSVIFDEKAMEAWVERLCLKYKTVGKTRTFTTHGGEAIQVAGGDYGWRLDYRKMVDSTANILSEPPEGEILAAYLENPTKEGQEAMTVVREPEYANTAFRRDYAGFEADWDPQNYSEVDLTEQRVYVYRKGVLAFSGICVSGLPMDGRETETGCWYIKDRKEEYTLVGADYVTPTRYWVRITWTGIGYHYLDRDDWEDWSPKLYQTKGSHGCLNLQLADAEQLYGLVRVYDAVFIHY